MDLKVKKELRALVSLPARLWSETDKQFVKAQAFEMGHKFSESNCKECYKDEAILLLTMEADREIAETLTNTKRRLFLRPNLCVLFNGKVVSNETITSDKAVKDLLKEQFPTRFVFTREQLAKKYGINLKADESNTENEVE